MKSLAALVVLLFLFWSPVWATRKTASSNSGQGWGVSTNWSPSTLPANGDSVIIPAGKTITVKTNIYNNSPVLQIVVYGTLDFAPGGKLVLGAGSTVNIMTGGFITSSGSASEIISIDNVIKYNAGTTTTIVGPAYADQYTGTSPSGFSPGLLKVNLLSVVAAYTAQQELNVKWLVSGETSSNYYEVESSADNQNWIPIYKQPSLYNNQSSGTYSITIKSVSDDIKFIRVKEVDLNGALSYSKVVSVNYKAESNISLSAYPVPAASTVTFRWHIQPDIEVLSMKVYNISGALMMAQNIPAKNGTYMLNVQNYPKGCYKISLLTPVGDIYNKTIVVQ